MSAPVPYYELWNRNLALILSREDPNARARAQLEFERLRGRQARNVDNLRGSTVNNWLDYARDDFIEWEADRHESIRIQVEQMTTDAMVSQYRRIYGSHAEEEAYDSWRRCVPHWDGSPRNGYAMYLNNRIFAAVQRRPKSAGGAAKRPRY